MGITIHWEQKEKKNKIPEKVVRECIGFVEDVAKKEKWEIWFVQKEDKNDLIISVSPHPESETVVLIFKKNRSGECILENAFCKTQYAGFEIHKKVCKLLHAINQAYIPLRVYDEAKYYGVWDEAKGKENFGEGAAILKGFSDYLDKEFKGKTKFESACKNTKGWVNDFLDHSNLNKAASKHLKKLSKMFKSAKSAIEKELKASNELT